MLARDEVLDVDRQQGQACPSGVIKGGGLPRPSCGAENNAVSIKPIRLDHAPESFLDIDMPVGQYNAIFGSIIAGLSTP